MENLIVNYVSIYFSNINEQEMQGNNSGDEITDNVDRSKNIVGYKIVQNATLPYLEKLQNLLLNPPPVSEIIINMRLNNKYK